ncbi:MAG: PQQ-binding-like beta-propeller repeat protein [Candidatus Micrarchaeaceae archaeon]
MRAVIFTLDAVFALIVASVSISILLYVNYITPTPYTLHYSEAASIMQELSSASISSIASSNPIAYSIVQQSNGENETWPMQMKNAYGDAGNPYGPIAPLLYVVFTANSPITTPVIADYGKLFFASSNVLYAVNATTGSLAWTKSTQTSVSGSPAVYDGVLFYSNTSDIVAVNAQNGAQVWSTNALSGVALSAPIQVYAGKLLLGAINNNLYAVYANNGTVAWSISVGAPPASIVAVDGSIAVRTTSNMVALISGTSNSMVVAWSKSFPASTTALSSLGNAFVYGVGTYANATYTDGSSDFSYSTGQTVNGSTAYRGIAAYQLRSGDGVITASGTGVWSLPMPSSFGYAYFGAEPVLSDGFLYTLWSNNTIVAQNASTGSIVWHTSVPKQFIGGDDALSPQMTLAYGRLYIIANNKILAYGSCNAQANDNILHAAAQLYINGDGSCATALADYMRPMANYSILINSTYAPGMEAASFNGASSYINLLGNASLMSNDYTWAFWIKPSTWNANAMIIGENTNAAGAPYLEEQVNATSDRYQFSVNGSSAHGTVYAKASVGSWQFVVAEYSITTESMYIYVNGSLASTQKKVLTTRTPGNITVGWSPVTNLYFNGEMADLQIYDTELSAQQVEQLYLRGIGGGPVDTQDLVAWYPLEGDTNDYSAKPIVNTGYAVGISYAPSGYLPLSLSNAFEISKSTVSMPLVNASGFSRIYNVGVYTWR